MNPAVERSTASADDHRIRGVAGTMIPVRGHDIDTDQITPARFLKTTRFEGLESHVFEDVRAALRRDGGTHPFDRPDYATASVLIVQRNFGCGSSREHSPQALKRWGIRAIIGASFSEIFFGNSVAIGLPCLTAGEDDVEWLLRTAERDPATGATIDLTEPTATVADRRLPLAMPCHAQEAFVAGTWDATALLLDGFDDVEAVAARLPYVGGFTDQPGT